MPLAYGHDDELSGDTLVKLFFNAHANMGFHLLFIVNRNSSLSRCGVIASFQPLNVVHW